MLIDAPDCTESTPPDTATSQLFTESVVVQFDIFIIVFPTIICDVAPGVVPAGATISCPQMYPSPNTCAQFIMYIYVN